MQNIKTNLDIINDPNRSVALVIQGGGMRGAYSGGVLAKFLNAGLQNSFTHLVANSAGALNGAYFLAGQAGAVNVYIDLLSNKEFIDLTRRIKKVDIDYMVDTALHKKYPIDLESLKSTRTQLHIIVTDAISGKRYVINDHKEFRDIYEEFRATSAMPVLYDKKIKLNKKYFIDGGVSDLIPVLATASYNPTDIVVVMTRPLEDYRNRMALTKATKSLIKKLAKRQTLAVQNLLPTNQLRLKNNLDALKQGSINSIKLHILSPQKKLIVGTATINKQKLEQVAEQGWSDAEKFLNHFA